MVVKVRQQSRIRGVIRVPRHSSLLPAINRKVEEIAARWNVSKSFVVAVALAEQFGIEHESYVTVREHQRRRPLRRVK